MTSESEESAAPRTPELTYSEVEEQLRASVRDLLTDRSPLNSVLARVETGQPYDDALWQALARDLGVAGLLVPEADGGAGASAREVAVVLEELGRAAAPTPYLGSAVLATSALLAAPRTDATAELLAALAAGDRTATIAVPLTAAPAAPFPDRITVAGGAATGGVNAVAELAFAEVAILPARDEHGEALFAVDLSGPGVTRTAVTSFDLTRPIGVLDLADAPVTKLVGAEHAASALRIALTTGAGLLAAEQVGIAQWALDTTVGYVKQRYQFGRPIGSFQAVKHRLADVWAELSTARATSRAAADALAAGPADAETALLVTVAAAYCSPAAVHAAEEAVQLHGGIGMTWEHPAHLYLARAKADELALGTADRHRAALAVLADLPA